MNRRLLRSLQALALVAIGLAPMPARAAATYSVRVADFSFSPKKVVARSGDRIEWTWISGTHDVTAYANATFASGLRAGGTFSFDYAGGTVLYRCTPHSSLGAGSPPVCTGMCARITDEEEPLDPPAIVAPLPGATTPGTVTVSGWASGARVDVREGTQTLGSAIPDDETWSLSLTLGTGPHTIAAVVVDAGTESAASPPVSFIVDADPPSVAMEQPTDLQPVLSPVTVAGTASDTLQISTVSVVLRDRLLATEQSVPARCDACGSDAAVWSVTITAPPGVYELQATARDGVGNASSTPPITILVV